MKLLKDYDVTIQYYLSKVSMVVDALSQKLISIDSLACLGVTRQSLASEIQELEIKFINLGISRKVARVLANIEIRPTFIEERKAKNFENVTT